MGYYTSFELRLEGSEEELNKFLLEDPVIYYERFSNLFYEHDDAYHSNDSWKWYDHNEDMKDLSTKYTNILFELTGYGEEQGDIWRKFYKNGVTSGGKAAIVFPEYEDENA